MNGYKLLPGLAEIAAEHPEVDICKVLQRRERDRLRKEGLYAGKNERVKLGEKAFRERYCVG